MQADAAPIVCFVFLADAPLTFEKGKRKDLYHILAATECTKCAVYKHYVN